MSTIRDDVARLYPELLAIPVGVTCEIKPIQGQVGVIMKYQSGGSFTLLKTSKVANGMSNLQATTGCSFALGGTLGAAYTVGTNEILNISMCDSIFIFGGGGATCLVNVLRLRSIGDW
jgi:hypothetical protein